MNVFASQSTADFFQLHSMLCFHFYAASGNNDMKSAQI